jgi:hypothetical protein
MLSAAAQFLGDDVSRVEKGAWALALQALSQLSSDTCTTSWLISGYFFQGIRTVKRGSVTEERQMFPSQVFVQYSSDIRETSSHSYSLQEEKA